MFRCKGESGRVFLSMAERRVFCRRQRGRAWSVAVGVQRPVHNIAVHLWFSACCSSVEAREGNKRVSVKAVNAHTDSLVFDVLFSVWGGA